MSDGYKYSISVPVAEVDRLMADLGRTHRPEYEVEIKLTEALQAAAELGNEVNRLRQDAARYRWLRNDNAYIPEEQGVRGAEELDELCDDGIEDDAAPEPTHD